jgi:hypothetical protein
LVGVAVNVTVPPWQMVLAEFVIDTAGLTLLVTAKVRALLVAVCPLAHVALLVIKQVTASP